MSKVSARVISGHEWILFLKPKIALLGLMFVAVLAGCAHEQAVGPLFTEAPEPGPGRARVYFYRADAHHSYSLVELRFDGRKALEILDQEYLAFELTEGTHELEFRLQRRFWSPSWIRSAQRVRASPGQTLYFEISVEVIEHATPASRDMEIQGRLTGTAREVVSIQQRSSNEATNALRFSHLHTR